MEFFNKIHNFDEHIEKSIPNYNLLTQAILSILQYFKVDNYNIYDLGCGTGKLLSNIKHNGKLIGIDNENNLLGQKVKCDSNIIFENKDLNNRVNLDKSCIILSIFTLQFIYREARQELINNIFDSLIEGGAFIFAEKVFAENGNIQELFTFPYYEFKSNNFSYDEILQKEKDIRGIMQLNTSSKNYEMVKNAGFKNIVLIYKFFNFECWICIK